MGFQRYALVNADVQKVGQHRVRVRTLWTVVEHPGSVQVNGDTTLPSMPPVPGVMTFMPRNALVNPVYVFISHLDGRRIRVSYTYRDIRSKLTRP